jgi:hypothetical protein
MHRRLRAIASALIGTSIATLGLVASVPVTDGVFGAPSSHVAEAAAPGNWSSSITVQNQGSSDASVTVKFIDQSGAEVAAARQTSTIAAGGSKLWYVPNVPGLPSGQYSVVVESDQPVVAIGNLASTGPATGGSYDGVGSPSAGTSMFIPSAYKAYYGYTSSITAQNTETAADVQATVTFKGGSVNYTTPAVTIKAGAAHTWDQADISQLPPGWVGSATVGSVGGNIASVFNVYTAASDAHPRYSITNGAASGATVSYLPVLYKGYYGFDTSFLVQNVDSATNAIRVTYSNGSQETASLAPGESKLFYQPNNANLPRGFNGSAIVESTNAKQLLAVVNIANLNTGRLSAYNGFVTGTTSVSLPAIYKYYYGWVTSLTVQNIDTVPVNVDISYSNGATEPRVSLQPGQSKLYFQPNTAGLPNGFSGSAVVTATGGKIVAVVNEEKQKNDANSGDPGAGDWLMSYNGFNK